MSFEVQLHQGDIFIENGRVKPIYRSDKLIQQAAKMLMTRKGGFFHPEYGSNIYNLIGRYQSEDILQPLSEEEVKKEMIYYQELQLNQELVQDMDDEEVLFRILRVDLKKISSTIFQLDIDVLDRKGAVVNVSTIQEY